MVFAECVLSLYISVLWGLISPDGSIVQVTCSMLKEHLLKRKWTLSIVVCLCTLSHAYLIRTSIYESFRLLWVQFFTIVFDISHTLCSWTISSGAECPLGPVQHRTIGLNYTHDAESTRKGEGYVSHCSTVPFSTIPRTLIYLKPTGDLKSGNFSEDLESECLKKKINE